MSTLILAIALGFIQAVTEFLPISSSGHLILVRDIFHFDPKVFNLSFDIILHFGTLVALVVFFRKDLLEILKSLFRKNSDKKLLYGLILATLPAILVGFVFNELIEEKLRNSLIVILMLFIVGVLFLVAEKISNKLKTLKNLNLKDAILIGVAQSLALIPGISRSGITIVTGLFLGFKREEAAKFSFLLSIPTVFLVSLKDIYDLTKENISSASFNIYITGFFASALTSFFVVKFFLNYLKKHTLVPFAYYRFALAVLVLLAIF